jgi:hypothetical protein
LCRNDDPEWRALTDSDVVSLAALSLHDLGEADDAFGLGDRGLHEQDLRPGRIACAYSTPSQASTAQPPMLSVVSLGSNGGTAPAGWTRPAELLQL